MKDWSTPVRGFLGKLRPSTSLIRSYSYGKRHYRRGERPCRSGRLISTHLTWAILLVLAIGSLAIEPDESMNNLTFGTNVRVDDTGAQLSGQTHPSIAVDETGNVYVVWHDDRNIGSNIYFDIFLAKSTDGGKTFGPNVRVDDGDWGTSQYFACVSVDKNGTVYVVWFDNRNGNWDIYLAKSTDGGLSFGPNVRVDDAGNDASNQEYPSMAVDQNGIVFVAWTHHKNFTGQIRLAKSFDGGASFEPSVRVNDLLPESAGVDEPSAALDAVGNVYVSWADSRGGAVPSHIYLSKSTDGGQSFDPDVRVDDGTRGVSGDASIKVDKDGNICVVWIDARSAKQDIYFAKSTDGGLSFGKNVPVDDVDNKTIGQLSPSLTVDSTGTVYVTWTDKRDNYERNVFIAISTDGGSSFGEAIRVDDTGVAIADQRATSIAIFERNLTTYVYLAWMDQRNGNWDIYSASSTMSHLRPELAIEEEDIGLLPSTARLGELVSINATIHNVGDLDAPNVTVRFFDGDPIMGNQIDTDRLISQIAKQETANVSATWNAPTLGIHEIFVVVDPNDTIAEYNESNNTACRSIEVYEPIPEEIFPPTNLTTEVVGEDVRLNWTVFGNATLDHFLIYRSENQIKFDFYNPIHNTSNDPDPLVTNWVDVGANSDTASRVYYYTIRAVGPNGTKSTTSNTAGKWTENFPKGRHAFSLPLEPFANRNVSWFSENIPGTEFVRWMNASGHWVTHYPSMGEGVNDIPTMMGDSYEISPFSPTNFTFCGYPASMIRFQEDLGDSLAFRQSLSINIEGSDVNLSWEGVMGASEYFIYRSEDRDGLHSLSLPPVANTPSTFWRDLGVVRNERSEYYHMVIPIDPLGEPGSGTYSVGVFTEEYQSGTDAFALPLKPVEPHSLDWYCDNIPNVVGMIHLMKGYWRLHAREMPEGVYDAEALQAEGYQISIDGATTTYTFVGY